MSSSAVRAFAGRRCADGRRHADCASRRRWSPPGSQPQRSTIPGLEEAGYLTSETVFDLTVPAQAPGHHRRRPAGLRSGASLLAAGHACDPRAGRAEISAPRGTGCLAAPVVFAGARRRRYAAQHRRPGRPRGERRQDPRYRSTTHARYRIDADEILLEHRPHAQRRRTSAWTLRGSPSTPGPASSSTISCAPRNPRIYAAGDVCLSLRFTNAAEATARMAVQNAFAAKRAAAQPHDDPVVHLLRSRDRPCRHARLGRQRTLRPGQDLHRDDAGCRARHHRRRRTTASSRSTSSDGTDKILGATIVASRASEMINEIIRRHEHRNRHAQAGPGPPHLSGAIRRHQAGRPCLYARPAGVLAATGVCALVRVTTGSRPRAG